jgi:hypothetical protein
LIHIQGAAGIANLPIGFYKRFRHGRTNVSDANPEIGDPGVQPSGWGFRAF